MINYPIINWKTKETTFVAKIDCDEGASNSLKKRLAVLWGIENGKDFKYANLKDVNLKYVIHKYVDFRYADFRYADFKYANFRYADFRGADFSYADFEGADFEGADFSYADFEGANLKYANLTRANSRYADFEGANLIKAKLSQKNIKTPMIKNIHTKLYNVISKDICKLQMDAWHSNCGTAHCRAGWIVTLAGKEGKVLEEAVGTANAAYIIYNASDPNLKENIDFYASNEDALKNIKRLAGVV